ncbi:cold-shock protein [Chitinophaga lutea]
MKERKLNNNKGKNLEDMLVYLDENGNLSAFPPRDNTTRLELAPEDLSKGEVATPGAPVDESLRTGRITFFNTAKGFGFIEDSRSKESTFFHVNQLLQPVQEGDEVSFSVEKTSRGNNAVSVRRIR